MHISSIAINNYKSFSPDLLKNKIEFNAGVNVLIGKNNSGKTTIIEAIRLASPQLLFETMTQASFGRINYHFDLDLRKYITPESIHKYAKGRPDYFEFEIEFKGLNKDLSDLFRDCDFEKFISFEPEARLKYKLRYFPMEQYQHSCFLVSLETNKIIVECKVPDTNEELPQFDRDKLLKLKTKRTSIEDNLTEELVYVDYLNSEAMQSFHYDEIIFLKKLKYFFENGFISPYQHLVKTQTETVKSLPEYQLLWDINYYEKLNPKLGLQDELKSFSKKILGKESFSFIYEGYDFQKNRSFRQIEWDAESELSEEEEHERSKSLKAGFSQDGISPFGIEFESLGDGIKRSISLFWYINLFRHLVENGGQWYSFWMLIDELEVNAHPTLTHHIYNEINGFVQSDSKFKQFILSTHSNFILDKVITNENYKVLQVDRIDNHSEITKLNQEKIKNLLDAMGFKASQILQSNGIVWVEGPSDIIYIDHFIRLFCEKYGFDKPTRGSEYDYLMYGGASLKHHKISRRFDENLKDKLINATSVNQNYFFVFDKDNFKPGREKQRGIEKNKAEVIKAINSSQKWWMTNGTYIEFYLPKSDLKHFEAKIKGKQSKVDYAKNMIIKHDKFDDWFGQNGLDLEISKLVENIKNWNK
jgi:hypothetical protein